MPSRSNAPVLQYSPLTENIGERGPGLVDRDLVLAREDRRRFVRVLANKFHALASRRNDGSNFVRVLLQVVGLYDADGLGYVRRPSAELNTGRKLSFSLLHTGSVT